MLKSIKEYLLNTPEKYWVVIIGYHLHKSFFGMLLIIIGLLLKFMPAIVIGLILILLSISGHIYTKNKPYFKLWDKYHKRSS